jgi:subtilisin family serine protease
MLTGFGQKLAATLLYCLVISLIGLGGAQAEKNNPTSRSADSVSLYEPDKLEFIAGPGCVSMPAGVTKLYFDSGKLKSAASASLVALFDSAVVDGAIVTEMSSPALSGVAFSPDFIDVLSSYEIDYVARNVPPAVPGETFDVISDGIPQSYDLSVFYRLHFSDTLDASVVKAALEAVPCVDSVGYWPVIHDFEIDPGPEPFKGPFRDQLSDGQWYLKASNTEHPGGIDVEGAWKLVWDSLLAMPDVVISIVDSRFGTRLHADLEANLHRGSRVAFSHLPWDPHGTWVSGVTSAAAGSGWVTNANREVGSAAMGITERGIGIVGIAPTVKALLVNNSELAEGDYSLEARLESMSYAVYYDVGEISAMNCSWGAESPSATLRALTEVAYYDKNIVVVASSGNLSHPWNIWDPRRFPYTVYPANYPHVLSVGGNTESGLITWFSNGGRTPSGAVMKVDVMAPGEDILTTGSFQPKVLPPPEKFDPDSCSSMDGTSFSAPMVTGIVALMKVANRSLCAATIRDILAESCHQWPGRPVYDQTTGYGIINARLAVKRAIEISKTTCDALPGDANADCYVNYGDVKYIKDFLFAEGPAPKYPSNADANGDCVVSIGDVSYLITYIYLGGAPPLPGCSAPEGEEVVTLPQAVTLGNYPNPFNPETTIRYSLSEKARVSIDIFNLLGERVTTLVDEDQAAGEHLALWDGLDESGTSVATGVYFYRLTVGGEVFSKKMMLLK